MSAMSNAAAVAQRKGELLVLTPEHVQIKLLPAGMGTRFMAWFIDGLLITGIISIIALVCVVILPEAVSGFVLLTLVFLVMWSYHIYFETWRNGQSPGKRAMGLRVVDRRGLPLTFQQSFIRTISRELDAQPGFLYGVGGLICLLDPHQRRIGDIAADTIVIRESQPMVFSGQFSEARKYNSLRTPQALRMIRHHISLEEREFLLALCLRADALDSKARYDLMEAVGEHYRGKLNIDDPHLSGENLVRGITAVIFDRSAG